MWVEVGYIPENWYLSDEEAYGSAEAEFGGDAGLAPPCHSRPILLDKDGIPRQVFVLTTDVDPNHKRVDPLS